MSQGEKRSDVVRVTKVRHKLKGDASWLKRSNDQEAETKEDKPWLAEVRASRQNGAPVETSPVSSPVAATQPPTKPTERAPTTGYRSRGIFPPSSSSPTNDFSKTTQFTKRPSDSYKKIASHTVKPTSENQGSQLSAEEQEKRTEAASNVLKKSSVRERSYVLSAAKKFESVEPDNTVANNTVSFVAKRVEIADDEESPATPAPASSVPASPVAPVTSAPSASQPTPRKTVDATVKTTADAVVNAPGAPKVPVVTPEPREDAPPKLTVNKTDPFGDMEPGCTKVATPLPELITECIQAASAKPGSEVSGEAGDDPLAELTIRPSQIKTWPPPDPNAAETELPAPLIRTAVPPAAAFTTPLIPAPLKPTPASTTPLIPAPLSPTPASTSPLIPAPLQSTPASLPPVIPAPLSPTPLSTTPLIPTPLQPIPASTTPLIPAPLSPTLVSTTPLIPAPLSPTLMSTTPLIPAPISPTPASPPPVMPAPASTTPLIPVPLSPTPVSTTPLIPAPLSPPPASTTPVMPEPLSPTSQYPPPVMPLLINPFPVVSTMAIAANTEPEVQPVFLPEPALQPEPVPESPKPSSNVDTLAALSDTLISFGTTSSSVKVDEPAQVKEEGGSATENRAEDKESDTDEDDVENEYQYDDPDTDSDDDDGSSKHSACGAMSDDLQAVDSGPEESADPDPVSPGRWSKDLLSGQDSESIPAKTSGPLDLLSADLLATNTETRSTQREEGKSTDETAKETQSQKDNADVWSSRVTTEVTTISSADPFDPYPIGTTSPNSSSDLLRPLSTVSINRESSTVYQRSSPEIRMSGNALESLADDVIPIDTDTTRLSTRRSWATSWETSTPQLSNTEESQKAEGHAGNPETMIKFERKSSENDSPWDRWTSPTVYSISRNAEEEEQEEERNSYGETTTVTTVTTVREIHSQAESVMDRYESYSGTVMEEEPRVRTPEPEPKKGFVYLKEYVNSTEMSSLNSGDSIDRGSGGLNSSSINYSYSSPSSRIPLSSTCNYCGEQVGDDAKITIEHLGINCHPHCFKCGLCSKPMGDLLHSMFIHGGKVHCESCYATV